MIFPSNSFHEKNEENLNSNLEIGKNEVEELSNKVKTQIQRGNENIKSTDYFIAKRKLDESFNSHLNNNFDWKLKKANFDQLNTDLSKTFQPSSSYSSPPFSTPSQFFEYEQRLIRIQTEIEAYINQNQPFSSNIPKHINYEESMIFGKEEMRAFKKVFYNLVTSLQLVSRKARRVMKRIPNIAFIWLIRLVTLYLIYQFIRSITLLITYLLKLAFSLLPKKIRNKKEQSKKEDKEKDVEIEESKGFWNKNVGWWSQIIKINRGGHLLPLEEVNIYEFSELNKEQALLFVSPIPYFIQFRNQLVELEELLGIYQSTNSRQKRFRLKFKILTPKVRSTLFGIAIFMSTSNGSTVLSRNQNVSQSQMFYSGQVISNSVQPVLEVAINEPNLKGEHNIDVVSNSTKDQLKITLKPANQVRKRAKMVRLSDLPPLPDQYFDIETYSPHIAQPTKIKVR